MSDIYNGPPVYGDTNNTLLLKLWYRLQALVQLGGGGGGGGGSVTQGTVPWVTSSATVTPHFIAPVASSTTVIPIGAIGSGIIILTGTGTINGIAWPTGTPWNEANKLAANVTLILANPGTAVIYYGT